VKKGDLPFIFMHGILNLPPDMKSKRKSSVKKRVAQELPSRKHVNKIIDWCVKNYGRSKYNKEFPTVMYRTAKYMDEDPRTMAYYDEDQGVMYIKKEDHKNLYQLASTIIHEYTHYKQNLHHYNIISMYTPYKEHPMEKEANKIARRDVWKCLREIKSSK
jgi:Zn-dependent peptidase ImmA (M78 family)